MACLKREMETLGRGLKASEAGCGENVLNPALARACIRKRLNRVAGNRLLAAHHAEIPAEFKTLSDAETL